MIGNNNYYQQRGFTLVEILISIGIFSLAMIVATIVFVSVNGLQQHTANMEKLQNEGRYIMEKITKEVRGRKIDYEQSEVNNTGRTNKLVFKKDEFGEVLSIYFEAASSTIYISSGESFDYLNSDEVIINKAEFVVYPETDPLVNPTLVQPRVTILLQLQNSKKSSGLVTPLNLQTTISSKVYH